MAGKLHPSLMGSTFAEGFPEVAHQVLPMFDAAETTKKAMNFGSEGTLLFLERNGILEESYFVGNITPIRKEGGRVGGFYNAPHEVTREKLIDRRRTMLNLVSAPTQSYTLSTIGTHIIEALRTNSFDVPVALLYQLHEGPSSSHSRVTLWESIGVPSNHQLAVREAYLDSEHGLIPLLTKAYTEVVTVPVGDNFAGVEWVGWGEPSKFVSAIPLSNAGRLFGFLVVGANPRRPIDEDHAQFMQDLSKQISSTIAVTVSSEETILREQRLQDQLIESERHIRYMAQHLDVGMEHLDMEGKIIWANEAYYNLVGHSKDEQERIRLSFSKQLLEEDVPKVLEAWDRVREGIASFSVEVRFKALYLPPSGGPIPKTVLLSAFPYFENGSVKSIMACMTDVSHLKWAESWQARAAREAQEAKRQQSEFTDIISHEVRNPLSAIFQLADGIIDSLSHDATDGLDPESCMQLLSENAEAAKIILKCAQHQKRIVDDVLVLSKLDFALMSLSPTPVRPSDLVTEALKLLEADLSSGKIDLSVFSEPSLSDLNVTWVLCDSLRVTQILINLLSNAIKFTKREYRREIAIRYGASTSKPRQAFPKDMVWASSKREHQDDLAQGGEWGNGEVVYLTFSIRDTGPGMSAEELRRLFNRFEQAGLKTSIKYGGSGLGLYISHSLSEKHNGNIGVSSQVGQGTTFAFYIKVRRKVIQPGMPSVVLRPAEEEVERETKRMRARVAEADIPTAHTTDSVIRTPVHALSQSYHILLVEDNLVNQRILKKQLIKAGCIVYTADNGAEALNFLQTTSCWKDQATTGKHLDIILMDWEMPVMDGLTASKEIRMLQRSGQLTKHIEIIAVTANARKEQVDHAMAVGIDAVFSKPFIVSDLLKIIKQRLDR